MYFFGAASVISVPADKLETSEEAALSDETNRLAPGLRHVRANRLALRRLGKPTTDEKGNVRNRMGATFEQETISWFLLHVRIGCQLSPARRGKALMCLHA
jgi:hypothetical protein